MANAQQLSLTSPIKRSWLDDDDLQEEEKEFLNLVSKGNLTKLRSLLEECGQTIDVDCCNCKGYRALDIAVDLQDEDLVSGLLSICDFSKVHIQGALLRSVEVNNIRLVKILVEKCEENEPKYFSYKNQQSVNLTPIMLAAINDNFEIILFLLNKGYYVVKPHVPKCGCLQCISDEDKSTETLRESIARINAYRALASPTYIVLSSPDPILTAFKLSSEARILSKEIPEHREVYEQLSVQCSQFSADFLQQCRNTEEVEILLSQKKGLKDIRDHCFARIWLAVYYEQKRFVAHPHCQQIMYSTWLEGIAVWKTFTTGKKILYILSQALLSPFLCIIHVLLPRAKIIKPLKVPFNRFIHSVTSYIIFLVFLLSSLFSDHRNDIRQLVVWPRVAADLWILGNVLDVVIKVWSLGFVDYLRNWWCKYDFVMHMCFAASETICFGVYVYSYWMCGILAWNQMKLPWWHPLLIGEGIFACACVLAFCRILLWYQMQSTLGPLGTSLIEMVNDVMRFFTIFFVLMFSFAVGINSMYRNYDGTVQLLQNGETKKQPDAFITVRKTFKALFWATFGIGEPDYAAIVVDGNFTNSTIIEHHFTENIGYLMWGFYHLLTVIIMLNVLIAMMAQSYDRIQGNADTEWKFARSTVWLSYFDGNTVVPSPFNLIPSVRRIIILGRWTLKKLSRKPASPSSSGDIYFRGGCCSFDEIDHVDIKDYEDKYQKLLRQLRRRYLDWRNQGQATVVYPASSNIYEEKVKLDVIRRLRGKRAQVGYSNDRQVDLNEGRLGKKVNC